MTKQELIVKLNEMLSDEKASATEHAHKRDAGVLPEFNDTFAVAHEFRCHTLEHVIKLVTRLEVDPT